MENQVEIILIHDNYLYLYFRKRVKVSTLEDRSIRFYN